VGAYYPEDIIQAVALSGNYAYVSAGGFHVVDVSDPASPRKASELEGVFGELAVSGDYVYVSEGGLRVIDISDPLNPVRLGHHETSSAPSAIAADRNFAYVGFQERGLELIDLSDPEYPVSVGGTSAFSVYDIALAKPGCACPPIAGQSAGTSSDGDSAGVDYVYVAGGMDGLIILSKPVELRFGPASIQDEDGIILHLSGGSGQRVIIQRSENLMDWEDWKTMTMNECPCEIIDDTTSASQYVYRAVVDESNKP
jgi:hypothetical protein